MMNNTRNCPQCNKFLTYSCTGNCNLANKNKTLCKECGSQKSNLSRNKLHCGLTRNCPICNKLLTYSNKSNCSLAIKANAKCLSCVRKGKGIGEKNNFFGKKHTQKTIKKMKVKRKQIGNSIWQTDEYRSKMSKISSGSNNPMYGKKPYDIWLNKYGKEEADRRHVDLKQKCSNNSAGENNPMYGKPTPQGAGNGWSGWYKGWYFRSLHELSYMISRIEKDGLRWQSGEKGDLRIEYEDWQGRKRTYTADFLVEGKYLIEVKPKRLHKSQAVLAKSKAAIKFCENKGYEYKIEDVKILSKEQLLEMYFNNKIKFLPRYEELFKKRFEL